MSEREDLQRELAEFGDLAKDCAQHISRGPHSDQVVRLVHLPTGTIVESSGGRSQIENYVRALRTLRERLSGQ